MSDLTVPAEHLNVLAATLAAIAPLTPPPTPKGRYLIVKALPKVQAAAQAHTSALKAFLDGAVTQDAEGQPIYLDGAEPGTITFTVRLEHQQAYADLQHEGVVLTGIRPITRAELGDCPITIQQDLVLGTCGFLADDE